VEKAELPTWGSVERVLGADWGGHTLLTATAVDEHSEQVGRPFFLNTGGFDGRQARTRRQIDELKKKVARYEEQRDALPPIIPNELGSSRSLHCFVMRSIGAGENMNNGIELWLIWRRMCCSCCARCMAAPSFRWSP
jgi:hypothetical protein